MGELAQAGGAAFRGPGMPALSNREMLKAKLQKDKFMTKPLSEIVASETEVCTCGALNTHGASECSRSCPMLWGLDLGLGLS